MTPRGCSASYTQQRQSGLKRHSEAKHTPLFSAVIKPPQMSLNCKPPLCAVRMTFLGETMGLGLQFMAAVL